MIDEALVQRVHEHGTRVIAWTVNEPAAARALRSWGVDGICTDVPRELVTAFA
jgi:glycerophosphoryl diester phosphodiesterase